VAHYSEIALKGKNRPEFARVLKRAIRRAMAEDEHALIEHQGGRFILTTGIDDSEMEKRLSKVFGLAWFARVKIAEPDFEQIRRTVLAEAAQSAEGSFRIEVRRSDKAFPMKSMELEKRLGETVVTSTGKKVNLSHPEQTFHVDVLGEKALVYSDKRKGPGGLPVGTAGRVMLLFSGGIDSPVAAWLLMKRGCTPVYLHFYLAPNPEWVVESKIIRLLKVLSQYSGKSTMILIPFADYQIATVGSGDFLEPSLFRVFMRRTAESLASKFGVSAIATGDCLSQAASQTLWNLAVFDSGSAVPILRPLLTYDKEEVVSVARRIGTYEASIEEYRDCCSIVARHPKTRVNAELVSIQAERLDFAKLAATSVDRGTLVTYSPSDGLVKVKPLSETMDAERIEVPHQNYKQGRFDETEVRKVERDSSTDRSQQIPG
jgi:thiamine biosynthesis protein ThiI